MSEYAHQAPQQDPPLTSILEVTDYMDGQLAVDRLSDAGFPVDGVKIIGHDIKSVEVVTGRMTIGKLPAWGAQRPMVRTLCWTAARAFRARWVADHHDHGPGIGCRVRCDCRSRRPCHDPWPTRLFFGPTSRSVTL